MWKSKNQAAISLSCCESEYGVAVSNTVTDIKCLYLFLIEIGYVEPCLIFVNNPSTIKKKKTNTLGTKFSKHINVKSHFFLDKIEKVLIYAFSVI